MGGSLGDAVKAAVFSFARTAAFTAVGVEFGGAPFPVKEAIHGVVGGAFAVAQGGRFLQGFAANAVGALGGRLGGKLFGSPNQLNADGSLNPRFDDSAGAVFGRTMVAAIAGGTASQLTGGKFANGAATAAIAHIFNYEGVGRRLGRALMQVGKYALRRVPAIALASEVLDDLENDPQERWFATYEAENPRTGQFYAGSTECSAQSPLSCMHKRMADSDSRARTRAGFRYQIDTALSGSFVGVADWGRQAMWGREQQVINYRGGIGHPRVANIRRVYEKHVPLGRTYTTEQTNTLESWRRTMDTGKRC